MSEHNKKSVSFRIDQEQLGNLKKIAARLRVRESELFRFAIDNLIRDLGELANPEFEGTDFLHLLFEQGDELSAFFNISPTRLSQIINQNLKNKNKSMEQDDIASLQNLLNRVQPLDHKRRGLKKNNRMTPEELQGYLTKKYLVHDDKQG